MYYYIIALYKGNEQRDRWYFDSGLWSVQTNVTSKANLSSCCHDCFWSTTNPKCISWMYNDHTKDCELNVLIYILNLIKNLICK